MTEATGIKTRPNEWRVRSAAELGEVTHSRRREQKLTQEQLALLVGSHRNQIRELERGAQTARLELLFSVLNELGLDLIVRPRDVHRGAGR